MMGFPKAESSVHQKSCVCNQDNACPQPTRFYPRYLQGQQVQGFTSGAGAYTPSGGCPKCQDHNGNNSHQSSMAAVFKNLLTGSLDRKKSSSQTCVNPESGSTATLNKKKFSSQWNLSPIATSTLNKKKSASQWSISPKNTINSKKPLSQQMQEIPLPFEDSPPTQGIVGREVKNDRKDARRDMPVGRAFKWRPMYPSTSVPDVYSGRDNMYGLDVTHSGSTHNVSLDTAYATFREPTSLLNDSDTKSEPSEYSTLTRMKNAGRKWLGKKPKHKDGAAVSHRKHQRDDTYNHLLPGTSLTGINSKVSSEVKDWHGTDFKRPTRTVYSDPNLLSSRDDDDDLDSAAQMHYFSKAKHCIHDDDYATGKPNRSLESCQERNFGSLDTILDSKHRSGCGVCNIEGK